jgi:hypothetical protein
MIHDTPLLLKRTSTIVWALLYMASLRQKVFIDILRSFTAWYLLLQSKEKSRWKCGCIVSFCEGRNDATAFSMRAVDKVKDLAPLRANERDGEKREKECDENIIVVVVVVMMMMIIIIIS